MANEWENAPVVSNEWAQAPLVNEPQSFNQQALRQGGLFVRGGVNAVVSAPAGLADAFNMAINQGLENLGIDYRLGYVQDMVNKAMTEVGLPEAETPEERVTQTGAQWLGGASGFIKGGAALASRYADEIVQRVATMLRSNPLAQSVGATVGGVAQQGAAEMGAGPVGQTVAGLAGAVSPNLGSGVVRQMLRGGRQGRQQVQENINIFEQGGRTTPSVAQATEGRTAQATERFLSRMPGSAGPMARRAENFSSEVGQRVDELADDIAPRATAERAGMQIERGVTGTEVHGRQVGGFVGRFKERAGQLYDDVDQYVNTNAPIELNNTRRLLAQSDDLVAGAPSVAKVLRSSYLEDLGVALNDDVAAALDRTGIEGLPYSAVKAIRSAVGEKIANLSLVTDVSKGQLKQLYGALSEDLKQAASAAGPRAAKAAARADAFYKAGMGRIETIERVINKNGGPEKVFQAALSGTKEGATTLRTVMKSLRPEEKRFVTAAVIRRMGRATAANQDAEGNVFSINTFLTEYNKLSPEAKGTLFGYLGPQHRRAIDSLAKIADNVRRGNKVWRNPSDTAQVNLQNVILGGGGLAAFTKNWEALAGVLGAIGGANLTARLMTNPTFVRWLAKATTGPNLGQSINTLVQLGSNDEDIAAIADQLQQQMSTR